MTGHGDPMEFMLRLEPGEVEPARRALEDAGVDFSPVDVMMCTASAGIPARTNWGHEIPELIESINAHLEQEGVAPRMRGFDHTWTPELAWQFLTFAGRWLTWDAQDIRQDLWDPRAAASR